MGDNRTKKQVVKFCPKCDKEHSKTGTYCSRSCANSRTFTEAAKKKKSKAAKQHWNSLSDSEKESKKKILEKNCPYDPDNYLESLLSQDWEVLGIQAKRLRVILEQDGKCNRCGLDKWQGEKITLEFEHKDGDKGNNSRDNVEVLCPNCHAMTKTWRGRKNKTIQNKVEYYLDKKQSWV